jgi:hypothetical protein
MSELPQTDAARAGQAERRLVERVLRQWTNLAVGGRFPRPDEIDPWIEGDDWANCLLIAVQSPVELSHFVAVGENLAVALCSKDTLHPGGSSPVIPAEGSAGPPLSNRRGWGNASGRTGSISRRVATAVQRRCRCRSGIGRGELPCARGHAGDGANPDALGLGQAAMLVGRLCRL